MLNKIFIMGRLGHDPEVRYTQAGKPVASFSLAVDRDYTDQATGKRPTDWIDVVAWDARARFVQQYFRKGRMAIVEGRLQVRDYTGRDGSKRRAVEVVAVSVKRRAVEVVADNVYFGDSKPAPDSEGNADESQLPSPPPQDFADQDDDGELPF